MKHLVSTALIATLALTTTALAFGPGMGIGQGFWSNGPQVQAQADGQQDLQFRGRGQGNGNQMGRGQGRGMRRGQGRGTMQGNQGQMAAGQNRGNRTGEPVFMDGWDDNEDGKVTLAEAKERRVDLFDALDENEDGKVVAAEFTEFLSNQKMPPEEATNGQRGLFGMTLSFNDANKDGAVTKDEFLGQTQAWLNGMDRNGDGAVSDADFGPRNGQMNRGGRGQGRGMGWSQQKG